MFLCWAFCVVSIVWHFQGPKTAESGALGAFRQVRLRCQWMIFVRPMNSWNFQGEAGFLPSSCFQLWDFHVFQWSLWHAHLALGFASPFFFFRLQRLGETSREQVWASAPWWKDLRGWWVKRFLWWIIHHSTVVFVFSSLGSAFTIASFFQSNPFWERRPLPNWRRYFWKVFKPLGHVVYVKPTDVPSTSEWLAELKKHPRASFKNHPTGT